LVTNGSSVVLASQQRPKIYAGADKGAAAPALVLAPSRRDHQQRRSLVDESGVRAEEAKSALAEFLVGTDESSEAVERGSRGRRQPREGEAELCVGGGL
jgi:hypothetical protein